MVSEGWFRLGNRCCSALYVVDKRSDAEDHPRLVRGGAGTSFIMTIRLKLTMAVIAVIFIANSVLSLVTVQHIGRVWIREVQKRVRLDLNSARAAYQNHIDGLARFLEASSLDRRVAAALVTGDRAALERHLAEVYERGGMDMLGVTDASGRVIHRACNPTGAVGDPIRLIVVDKVIANHRPCTGTVVMQQESLLQHGAELAARARFELQRTAAARPTEDTSRADGMVVVAAVPIVDHSGTLRGVLYAGDLLNRRYEIVDDIKEQVFQHEAFEGREIGTVTIFQGDLRVSTNVKNEDGRRAVGTRLSDAVFRSVLERGETWADRAFVVNDWYITAYEPIRDPTGKIIGALYVGLLEAPFTYEGRVIVGVFLAMVTVTTITSLALIFFVAKLVLRPIGRIITMSRKVVEGDLSARVGIRPPGEMGVLCKWIDAMANAVALRESQLKLATRRHIDRTEKLASIGRLAAGIAHEINNPLTGVLTFAHLLRKKENMGEQDQQDLDVIINETTRVSQIVRGLLDFARERPSVSEPVDMNQVMSRTLRLIRGQKQVEQITFQEDLAEMLPKITGDANQLEQVLLNLILNGCEAMPNGGVIKVSSKVHERKVHVAVSDTGCGIKDEHIDEIFEPFFSTKPVGTGTGLGLSVSYGIIQQHAGSLEVESEEGRGTTMTLVLPAVAERPPSTSELAAEASDRGSEQANPTERPAAPTAPSADEQVPPRDENGDT